jgi:uncharacterized membrane protein
MDQSVNYTQPPPPSDRARLDSVDRLRGLVMVLMALDHVRGHFTNPTIDPLDLGHSNTALFLTRWISHLCAPTFIFLAGTAAYLSKRNKTTPQLAWFLLTRGLWIVLLGLTLVKFCWTFELELENFNADVLWAIGWSMVVLAGLVFLPTWFVTIFGVAMIAGHNLLDPINPSNLGPLSDFWEILHRKDMQSAKLEFFGGEIKFYTQYPLIPWIGVMAAGYGFGALLQSNTVGQRRRLLALGAFLCLAFVVLRFLNVYGDPDPWNRQSDDTLTVLSFLNCHKYPPSLLFLLMTLGPSLILLACFERAPQVPGRPLLVFGRVPMFFYLVHLPLIHALALGAALLRYGPSILEAKNIPDDYGYPLVVVYGIWVAVVVVLYPVCRWFMGIKQRRRNWWLGYI